MPRRRPSLGQAVGDGRICLGCGCHRRRARKARPRLGGGGILPAQTALASCARVFGGVVSDLHVPMYPQSRTACQHLRRPFSTRWAQEAERLFQLLWACTAPSPRRRCPVRRTPPPLSAAGGSTEARAVLVLHLPKGPIVAAWLMLAELRSPTTDSPMLATRRHRARFPLYPSPSAGSCPRSRSRPSGIQT